MTFTQFMGSAIVKGGVTIACSCLYKVLGNDSGAKLMNTLGIMWVFDDWIEFIMAKKEYVEENVDLEAPKKIWEVIKHLCTKPEYVKELEKVRRIQEGW